MITKCILTAILLISGGENNPDGTYRVEVEEYVQVDPIPNSYAACESKWETRKPILKTQHNARFVTGRFMVANGEPTYVEAGGE